MLIKHSLYYLGARGIPGLVNFLALSVYTRLLTEGEFGRYALIISIVGFVHVSTFLSLLLIIGRFIPAHRNEKKVVMEPVLATFLALSIILFALGLALLMFLPKQWQILTLLAVTLAIAQGWHELNLRLATAQLEPGRYGLLSVFKALIALAIGAWLAWLGWGAEAPVIGLIIGSMVSWCIFGWRPWSSMRPRWKDRETLSKFVRYGAPLTITFILTWVISSSDRLLIVGLLDEAAAGLYSVGYDLAQHTLGLVLTVVNTAALPLAFRALEQQGVNAAQHQIKLNGDLTFVTAFSGAAGLIAIGPLMIQIFVGESFREGAWEIFPWIAVAAAVTGIKSFYFDTAFHLAKSSGWLIVTSGIAALMNVSANILLIPHFGIVGAAWSTLISLLIATVLSALIGRKVFPMPPVSLFLIKGGLVAACTYLGSNIVMKATWLHHNPLAALTLSLLFGALAAGFACIVLNVAGSREALASVLKFKKED